MEVPFVGESASIKEAREGGIVAGGRTLSPAGSGYKFSSTEKKFSIQGFSVPSMLNKILDWHHSGKIESLTLDSADRLHQLFL